MVDILSFLFSLEELEDRSSRSCWRRSAVSSSLDEDESDEERGRFLAVGDEVLASSALPERRAAGFFLGLRNMDGRGEWGSGDDQVEKRNGKICFFAKFYKSQIILPLIARRARSSRSSRARAITAERRLATFGLAVFELTRENSSLQFVAPTEAHYFCN